MRSLSFQAGRVVDLELVGEREEIRQIPRLEFGEVEGHRESRGGAGEGGGEGGL
jgi:hypothetical protein